VKRTPAFWLDLLVKLSLLLLLAFGAFSGLERFAGKAFGWRLIGYAIAAFLVPAIWAMRAVAIALRRTAILWELAEVTSRSASAAQTLGAAIAVLAPRTSRLPHQGIADSAAPALSMCRMCL